MTIENKAFITGTEYCLRDFFSGVHRIIIPDLQRDYCWGNRGDLVKNFITNIIDLFQSEEDKKDIKMGLIYGYESPENHIQLCDGQQRLTTLFLLLGYSNKYTKNTFRHNLIYNNDLSEPYLQYAIRESTLYFLSDLVKFFFIADANSTDASEHKKLTAKAIKLQPWYFKDYDLDPSIQSMIQALIIIEKEVEALRLSDTKIAELGKFILKNLFFLYYDMHNRKNGEETFVIINTTGEPLTTTENLKPLILSKEQEKTRKYYSEQWELWEDFFWQNRHTNDTADKGLNEFFTWVVLLTSSLALTKENFKRIEQNLFDWKKNLSLEEIKKYFGIVQFIFHEKLIKDFDSYLAPKESNDQIDLFKILPVIQYIYRFGNTNRKNITRVIRFFYNLARIDNVKKAIAELLPESIRIIKELPDEDITAILKIQTSQTLITEEVRFKLKLYSEAGNKREYYEQALQEAEDHPIWNGEIKELLLWSCKIDTLDTAAFDREEYKKYYTLFTKLFHGRKNDTALDITRRCLLTILPPEHYPKIFTGNTNYSFCREYSDWKRLIKENCTDFKMFFDTLNNQQNIQAAQGNIITLCLQDIKDGTRTFKDSLDQFLLYPELLSYCREKNIQWSGEKNNWILIPGQRATTFRDLQTYTLFLEIIAAGTFLNKPLSQLEKEKYSFSFNKRNWVVWFYSEPYEGNCCVFSTDDGLYTIDCAHQKDEVYTLNVRMNKKVRETTPENNCDQAFTEITKKLKMDARDSRYYLDNLTKKDFYSRLEEIVTALSR